MGSGQPWQPRSYPGTSESIWNRLGTTTFSRNLIESFWDGMLKVKMKWTIQVLVLRFLHSFVGSRQWKGHYSSCEAIAGDSVQWQMSWCPLNYHLWSSREPDNCTGGGGVTANLVLNQLQQIFCLQATNYHGITHRESRHSIHRMDDIQCLWFIGLTAPGHDIKEKILYISAPPPPTYFSYKFWRQQNTCFKFS